MTKHPLEPPYHATYRDHAICSATRQQAGIPVSVNIACDFHGREKFSLEFSVGPGDKVCRECLLVASSVQRSKVAVSMIDDLPVHVMQSLDRVRDDLASLLVRSPSAWAEKSYAFLKQACAEVEAACGPDVRRRR